MFSWFNPAEHTCEMAIEGIFDSSSQIWLYACGNNSHSNDAQLIMINYLVITRKKARQDLREESSPTILILPLTSPLTSRQEVQ